MNTFEILDEELRFITNCWKSDKNRKFYVPKIIHQVWVNDDPNIPEKWKDSPVEWKRLHPDWHHVVWNKELSRALIEAYQPQFIPTYDSFKHEIQRIDAVRYIFLQAYGGLYVDLDTIPLECIESHIDIDANVYLVNDTKPQNTYSNCLMLSKPGITFWDDVRETIIRKNKRKYSNKFHTVLEITGPRMLTEAIANYRGTICRLPNSKFNVGVIDKMSKEDVLAIGGIIQPLEGWSWVSPPVKKMHNIGKKIKESKTMSTLAVFLLILFIIIIIAIIYFWLKGVTMDQVLSYAKPVKMVDIISNGIPSSS